LADRGPKAAAAAGRNAPADIAILGGGLAGGLVARALAERRPDVAVVVIEPGEQLGGNHIWSFFDADVAAADRWLVDPLVAARWDAYDVAFPAYRRTLAQAYNSVTSERFDDVVRRGSNVVRGTAAIVDGGGVTLADGRRIAANAVIDARGPGDLATLDCGWQKFVGQLLRLEAAHGLERPIVMDATVDQRDGYRFVYVLPFGAERVFVEDTYYATTPDLDVPALRTRIADYAGAKGWRIATVEREEIGVLPVAIGGDHGAYWASSGDGAKAGMRAGLFHPMTGYSLPDAVRLAVAIAAADDLSQAALDLLTRRHAGQAWRARGFYRRLGAMLFHAAAPHERYRILERFYRLPAPLVGRFYAGASTLGDRIRVLSGRPPVPILKALGALARTRI
jgi:lycopene beta-cyclase